MLLKTNITAFTKISIPFYFFFLLLPQWLLPTILSFQPSGLEAYIKFLTDSEIEYEVRFARKKNNLLHASIAFGVLNDEFEGEEYALTNRGEVYRVMSTIVLIVKAYMKEHPNVKIYEFVGEPTADEDAEFPRKRLNLYNRYLRDMFDESWKFDLQGNRMVISKIQN